MFVGELTIPQKQETIHERDNTNRLAKYSYDAMAKSILRRSGVSAGFHAAL